MKSRLTALLTTLLIAITLCEQSQAQSRNTVSNGRPQSSSTKESYVTIEKLRVRYVETGYGPPVVMIHGNAGSVEDFEFGAMETLSSNYRVIAVERPGHGKSDRPGGQTVDVEFQARLLHQVLSTLGVVQPVLVGHSWGAAMALYYALQYPEEVSALILVAPVAYPSAAESRFLQTITKPPVIGDVPLILAQTPIGKHILKGVLRRAFSPQPLPEKYFRSAASAWLGRKQLRAYLEDESRLNTTLKNLNKRYSEINIPVVILTGDHDQIVSPIENAYRLKNSIANAQLIELKDTGHEIPQTHPENISQALSLIGSQVVAVKAERVSGGKQ